MGRARVIPGKGAVFSAPCFAGLGCRSLESCPTGLRLDGLGGSTTTAAASNAATAAADSGGKLYARPSYGAFLVEDIERCQCNVSDFFLSQSDFLILLGAPREHIRRFISCRRCAAHQRQR